jgi:hypothetical protein
MWHQSNTRSTAAGVAASVVGAAAICLVIGCGVASSQIEGATHVLYVITNRSGGDVTFDLDANGAMTESVSLAADDTQIVLDDCRQLDEVRLLMVCSSDSADCNALGIIIDPSEVHCGDLVDVYIGSAVDGQLQLSAFRRNSDGTPADAGQSSESSAEADEQS